MQTALSHYGIWEQETIPVIITSKKVRTGIRKLMESNVLVRKINNHYLFGFDYSEEGSFYLPYSDLEKTFIDMVVFNQKMDKEVLSNIKKKINKKKLSDYLKKYPGQIKKRVMKLMRS